jgi:3-methyl-2-oxobutanoate hydroxymethyltransferase
MNPAKITSADIRGMKNRRPIAALTAYDFPMTKLLDDAGIPLLLVGDSLGMVLLGYPDTTHVTLAEMEHHVRAAARAKPRALLAADMPFQSYQSPAQALDTARRLVAAGAEAVKAEGGRAILPQVQRHSRRRNSLSRPSGHAPAKRPRRKRLPRQRQNRRRDESACWPTPKPWPRPALSPSFWNWSLRRVAREITQRIPIPTIGVGTSPHCDGEILVVTDLLGLSPGDIPRHVKKHWDLKQPMRAAVVEWKQSVEVPGQGGAAAPPH